AEGIVETRDRDTGEMIRHVVGTKGVSLLPKDAIAAESTPAVNPNEIHPAMERFVELYKKDLFYHEIALELNMSVSALKKLGAKAIEHKLIEPRGKGWRGKMRAVEIAKIRRAAQGA